MVRTSAAVPIFVGLALFLSVAIAFAALLATVSAEETVQQDGAQKADAPPERPAEPVVEELPDDATLLKMKVRELKAILVKKGPDAKCLACTSKQEYVERIHETADWPIVEEKEEPKSDGPSLEELRAMFNKGQDNEEMKNLKKKLKEAGIDTSNIFTGADFDSEKFAKQFKHWDKSDGARAADSTGKEDSHVEL